MSARAAARTSKKGSQRAPRTRPSTAPTVLRPRAEDFRLTALRGDKAPMGLTSSFTQLTWDDRSTLVQGSVELRPPAERLLSVSEGDQLRLEAAPAGTRAFSQPAGWPMRLVAPSRDPLAGTISATLANDIALLQASTRTWAFGKSKARPRGWKADQATRWLCRRIGMPVARMPRATTHFSIPKREASAYEMVVEFWRREREKTGRRFVIELVRGVLVVREPKPSRRLMAFAGDIKAATVARRRRESFATVLVVTGAKRKGASKSRRAVRVTVTNRAARRRFGWVEDEVHLKAYTAAGARKLAMRRMARGLRPIRSVTISVQGDVRLRRGNHTTVTLPGESLPSELWVRSISHTITPAGHDMEVVVRMDDPMKDPGAARIKKRLAAAERKRKRRTTATGASSAPKTRKAAQRS